MHTKDPLVSVLISAYNHEEYIQNTILSIINQTYKNIELVIIDDGSTDNTYNKICEIEDESKKRFSNYIFKTQENIGCALTVNKLISLARGKYVYLIGSDDLAKPEAIKTEVEFLENNPDFGLAVGDSEIIDFNGRICYWKDDSRAITYKATEGKYKTFAEYLKIQNPNDFDDKNFGTYKSLYNKNYIPNGYLIRKELFNKITKNPSSNILEDWFLMLQLSKITKFKYIDKILYSYRWHQNNTIQKSEKINLLSKNTRIEENKVLNNCKNSLPEEINKIAEQGILTKRQGIPNLIEILTYKKLLNKRKVVKIFNIEILEFYK